MWKWDANCKKLSDKLYRSNHYNESTIYNNQFTKNLNCSFYTLKNQDNKPDIIFKINQCGTKNKNHKSHKSGSKTNGTKEPGVIRTRRILINPTIRQVKILKEWINICDLIYNDMVNKFKLFFGELAKNNESMKLWGLIKLMREHEKFPINHFKLRKLYIRNYLDRYKIPYCIASNAIKDFVTSIKSIFTKIKKGTIKNFTLKLRNYNRSVRTISIDHANVSNNGIYSRNHLGKMEINSSRNHDFKWTDIKKDFKIVFDKYINKFYIHVPVIVKKTKLAKKFDVIAFDPGEKIFLFGYGIKNYIKIGVDLREKIVSRLKKIDSLKKKIATKPSNKGKNPKTRSRKWKYKRAVYRHYSKIRNLVNELHFKTNNFVCKKYKRIMMTDFSAKKVSKKKGGLNKTTKRVLGMLSHYKYRLRLKDKCEEYSTLYLEVDESYTSITCGKCGQHNKIEVERQFICKKCKYTEDRDFNGARNILIKNRKLVMNKY